MNRFNIELGGFPFDADTLLFMQGQTETAQKLTRLFGRTYIIHGMNHEGDTLTDGAIVFNGEILPFIGGGYSEDLLLVQNVEQVAYLVDENNDGIADLKNAYFTRYVTPRSAVEELDVNMIVINYTTLKRGTDLLAYNMLDAFFSNTPLMYTGAINSIHPWFKLCDGTNGTPDLRGKFLVGMSDDAEFNAIGQQGGAKEVTLTQSQMPQHNHSGNAIIPPHTHGISNAVRSGGNGSNKLSNSNNIGHTDITQTSPSNQQNISFTTTSKGGNQPHENLPPYYTVAYIIFKGE